MRAKVAKNICLCFLRYYSFFCKWHIFYPLSVNVAIVWLINIVFGFEMWGIFAIEGKSCTFVMCFS